MAITKEEIAAGYDAITEKIGLDTLFYTRCVNMAGKVRGKVLDIGCGRGLLLRELSERFAALDLTGIDISPKLCELSSQNNPSAHIVVGDAEKLPFSDDSFDVVFMTEALEHMLDYDAAVSEIARVLKSGGTCIVTVPNRDWVSYEYYDNIRNKNLQPVDDHYFRFTELSDLLQRHHLKIKKVRGADNLYYYGWKNRVEQLVAILVPFLHKKMKRLIVRCENVK